MSANMHTILKCLVFRKRETSELPPVSPVKYRKSFQKLLLEKLAWYLPIHFIPRRLWKAVARSTHHLVDAAKHEISKVVLGPLVLCSLADGAIPARFAYVCVRCEYVCVSVQL